MSGLRKPVGRSTQSNEHNDGQAQEIQSQAKRLKKSERSELAASQTHDQWLSSDNEESGPRKEIYTEEDLPLGSILLDKSNHRTRYINVAHPTKNTLDPDHPHYQENEDLIQGLIDLAEHLKVEPLRQMPSVYRHKGKCYTAYGNRRFLAMLIAFGPKNVRRFKVYPKKPEDLAKARFQENFQREDVPLDAKILDFRDAQAEEYAYVQGTGGTPTVKVIAKGIGISAGAYSVFNRALKNDFIMKLIEEGKIQEFNALSKVVSLSDKDQILEKLGLAEPKKKVKPNTAGGRPRKNVQFPKFTNTKVVKDIINGKLSEFEWKDEDFESFDAITAKLNKCIEELVAQSEG